MTAPDMLTTMNEILGQLASGSRTLPNALLAMWSAGRDAERIDNLQMEKAQREAKTIARSRRGGGR